MRVAIITDFLSSIGGTEGLTVRVALGLRRRNHDVRVFCPRSPADRTWVRLLRRGGVPVVLGASQRLFPDDRGAQNRARHEAVLDRAATRAMAALFTLWRPDVLLANPMGPLLVAWLRRTDRPAIPVIGYEFSAADSRCSHWYPPDLPDFINEVDMAIAGCEASRRGIAETHGFTGRIAVVPPLVPATAALPLSDAPWALGCIARLAVEKGLDYLLAALPELRERHPRVTLDVYGEGYDRTRLGDLGRALAVDDIVTLAGGFPPSSELDAVAAQHTIFVQPSLYESVPTALLEVAARGRVIVASRVGGIPEFFAAGGQGALVPPGSPGAIAAAVGDLLDDPAQLAALGRQNAAIIAERYGHSQGLDTLEAVLRSVAG